VTDLDTRFLHQDNNLMAHLEWEAIRFILCDGKASKASALLPQYENKWAYWIDPFNDKASQAHKDLHARVVRREFTSLNEFYAETNKLLKPTPRGKQLKHLKKRTAQKSYQQDELGDDFIDNNNLISAAKIEAKVLSDRNASVEDIQSKAVELASLHTDDEGLPDGQMTVLIDLIQRQIDKHMHPDNIEAKIIDTDNKNLWFMWGKIKRNYPLGDTFPLTTEEARKLCGCSKTDVAPIMKKLEKLGAIVRTQIGARGANSGRAAIYRREV